MNQELFVEERAREWDDFHYILKIVESQGVKSLSSEQLERFIALYRKSTGDLMYAKTHDFDAKIVSYLNALVAKGHPYVYAPPPGSRSSLRRFFLVEFPELVMRHRRLFLFAAVIFLLAFFIAYITILVAPHNADLFISEDLLSALHERLNKDTMTGWAASPTEPMEEHPMTSSYIMTNNIRVGFFSFVYGIFLGVGTAYIVFNNGLLLGGVAGVYGNYNLNSRCWALILPHGVIELVAIGICAQAGFLIGQALICPGRYRRRDAIVLAGNSAIRLVVGTIPMFTIAAIIEGFITPRHLSDVVKLSFALLTALALGIYFFRFKGGRGV